MLFSQHQNDVISVTSLNRMARDLLESGLPPMWIAGEISNLTLAASGHAYFSLKDERAQIRCVMFRNRLSGLGFRLQEGMQVELRGTVSLYEARGDYQINVDMMRSAGLGRLYEAFEQLKAKLAAEGLFDNRHKKALPSHPAAIGIVTSLVGVPLFFSGFLFTAGPKWLGLDGVQTHSLLVLEGAPCDWQAQPLDLDAPARHLTFFEAQAWCQWAGRRLPTEAEWECAAQQPGWVWGQVWEWTASDFAPYPGFEVHPYRDYSAPWWHGHRVLRGACAATSANVVDVRYRNFFVPERRDIFAGFRSVAV